MHVGRIFSKMQRILSKDEPVVPNDDTRCR